jgi:hypothetical protein
MFYYNKKNSAGRISIMMSLHQPMTQAWPWVTASPKAGVICQIAVASVLSAFPTLFSVVTQCYSLVTDFVYIERPCNGCSTGCKKLEEKPKKLGVHFGLPSSKI